MSGENQPQKTIIEISTTSILKVILVLLALWFLYLISDIILLLFVVLILVSAIYPLADRLEEKKIPRWVSVLFIYTIIVALFSVTIVWLIPPFVRELGQLTKDFPEYWKRVISGLEAIGLYTPESGLQSDLQNSLRSIGSALENAAGGVFSTLSGIFGGIISFVLVLVITFYMVVEKDALRGIVKSIVPATYQPYLIKTFIRLEYKLGRWVQGQLILCLIVGLMVYIGLLILGVKYALILGIFAALTEFVPYLGPIIGSLPTIFVAFSQSPILAVFVIILFIVVQQLENHIIVPKVMQRVTGINPVISIISLLIGGKIAGVLGIVLAIPIVLAISVFTEDFFKSSEAEE